MTDLLSTYYIIFIKMVFVIKQKENYYTDHEEPAITPNPQEASRNTLKL